MIIRKQINDTFVAIYDDFDGIRLDAGVNHDVNECLFSISCLLGDLNLNTISGDLCSAFAEAVNQSRGPCGSPETDEWYEKYRAESIETVNRWRKDNNRAYPAVYRVKITVELEEVPENEAEAIFVRKSDLK